MQKPSLKGRLLLIAYEGLQFSFLQSISLAVFLKTKSSVGIGATPNSVRNYKCRRRLYIMCIILQIYFHSSHALLLFFDSPLHNLTDHGHICRETEASKMLSTISKRRFSTISTTETFPQFSQKSSAGSPQEYKMNESCISLQYDLVIAV